MSCAGEASGLAGRAEEHTDLCSSANKLPPGDIAKHVNDHGENDQRALKLKPRNDIVAACKLWKPNMIKAGTNTMTTG
jgi:hypothetical protein